MTVVVAAAGAEVPQAIAARLPNSGETDCGAAGDGGLDCVAALSAEGAGAVGAALMGARVLSVEPGLRGFGKSTPKPAASTGCRLAEFAALGCGRSVAFADGLLVVLGTALRELDAS